MVIAFVEIGVGILISEGANGFTAMIAKPNGVSDITFSVAGDAKMKKFGKRILKNTEIMKK